MFGNFNKKFFKEVNEVLKRRRITMTDFTRTPVWRQKNRTCTVQELLWFHEVKWRQLSLGHFLELGESLEMCLFYNVEVYAACSPDMSVMHPVVAHGMRRGTCLVERSEGFQYPPLPKKKSPQVLDVKVSWCWTELCCPKMTWFVLLHTQWH